MDPEHKLEKGICPKCDNYPNLSTPMPKNKQGGYECFKCGIEYRGSRSESEDMSGRRWFEDIMYGGPEWQKLHLEKKLALAKEEDKAILSWIQRGKI